MERKPVQLDKETWYKVRKMAFDREIPMGVLISNLVSKEVGNGAKA